MTDAATFETPVELSLGGSNYFLPELPDGLKASGIAPLHVSSAQNYDDARREFVAGAKSLGLGTRKTKHVLPQQLVVADVLGSLKPNGRPLYRRVVICIPRRATKTTAVFWTALGRCLEREDYMVAFTAQTGLKARARFMEDIVTPLNRMYPDEDARPFKINRSKGDEHVRFDNGSVFRVLPPIPDSFRGDAFDMVILDEAQEHVDPEFVDELLGAITPTMLTRPEGQIVVIGTAGRSRAGLLWDWLEQGRAGDIGIIEYAAPDGVRAPEEGGEAAGTWADPAVWESAHPGIHNHIELEDVAEEYRTAKSLVNFAREYLGIWPEGASTRFIAPAWVENCKLEGPRPSIPKHFVLAFVAHRYPEPHRPSSLVAFWRDDEGTGYIEVLEHKDGVQWVPEEVARLQRKYKVPVVYLADTASNKDIAQTLSKVIPASKLVGQNFDNVTVAATRMYTSLAQGTVRHFDQPALTGAFAHAVKGQTYGSKKWAFSDGNSGEDITALEAAAIAMRYYDQMPAPRALPRVTVQP